MTTHKTVLAAFAAAAALAGSTSAATTIGGNNGIGGGGPGGPGFHVPLKGAAKKNALHRKAHIRTWQGQLPGDRHYYGIHHEYDHYVW